MADCVHGRHMVTAELCQVVLQPRLPAPPLHGSQPAVQRHSFLPSRAARRRRQGQQSCRQRGSAQAVRAEFVSPSLFSDALAPLAALASPVIDPASVAVTQAFKAAISSAPDQLQPLLVLAGTDIVTVLQLAPSSETVFRLAAIWFAFFSQPAPAIALLDFYVFNPVSVIVEKKWSVRDLTLRGRMGGGNFGQVFEGIRNNGGERSVERVLQDKDKARRVVLKRVNLDTLGVRTDFLRSGTVARGAGETGKVEQYLCSRIRRNPLARISCAQYLGEFTAEASEFGFTKGTQWLIWRYESDSTLGDATTGALGRFPDCLARYVLSNGSPAGEEARDAAVVKALVQQILVSLRRLHRMGIVHRDIKPDNILVTNRGKVKLIDFGAAVDMTSGINFNPQSSFMDPRYCPPEEYVMPSKTPRPPVPFLAILLAPFTWLWGRPDLFDTYSVGVILLQLAVPQLRTGNALRNLNIELGRADYDLDEWRLDTRGKYDFELLDRNGKAGWDLARKLLRKRTSVNRGRLSAGQALRHRYFSPLG